MALLSSISLLLVYPRLPHPWCTIWHFPLLNLIWLVITKFSDLSRSPCKASLPSRELTEIPSPHSECYQMCMDHPAWCAGCFLSGCLLGLNPGQALTSAEIINIFSLPNLHKSFKQTGSQYLPPEPHLRFSSPSLIVPWTGCLTLLSLW